MSFSNFVTESKESKQKHKAVKFTADLSPILSKTNIESHMGRTKGYAQQANTSGDAFNVGGIKLHNIWWETLQSPKSSNKPVGDIAKIIDKKYGSFGSFKDEWEQQARTLQGSGWIVLLKSGRIMQLKNHTYVDGIVMILDMWEHAYITDYDADKSKYISKMWMCYNWEQINSRL
jgi:superoxide dismutase